MIRSTSPYSMNYSPSPQPLVELNDDISSPYRSSFLEDYLTKDSTFKYMPILKHISTKNMVPIYDYE